MGNSNKSLVNLIVGIVLVVIGIAWYVIDIPVLSSYLDNPITFTPMWKILALFVLGMFGICVFFIGLILAWMGWDDYKMEKEMASSEKPETKEKWGKEEEEMEEEAEGSDREAKLEKELRAEMEKETENSEFTCDVCGKTVKSKAGLAAHKRSHK
ncbi:MAG: C2H2-type zinc finger protein [ANME-2 cluster archaeon]|nr:C2H2-type zinc finger protein [ANME-2 cluster archaeon]MDF1558240.1 C2H2-type zinc finger protein [ANME-2 cluster archaeon]